MKKFIVISFLAAGLLFATTSKAQEKEHGVKKEVKKGAKDVKEGVEEAGHDVGKGAKKVGNKTAEIASKGKAKITDEVYKDKVGPNGQTIYIDNNSKYYWIDKKGHKHYVASSQLRDKTS
ncbi:MAG: hypothetical protein ICV51_19705 [Flavisolibacter sp.]|nr:hypothetical protein [Flavisolibacter sp.]MBD0295874.1 hypothetical protein [Flavisolibacter sp.]MBD0352721.1 hypothetical protein [Flavisolibacter sp.]MBD0368543.1 hypothetical protein [Flavisolibacter sp.]MBD0377839.1 hypothetical protein [Flavisolibacter sp.]